MINFSELFSHPMYVVGGAVRDSLLGLPTYDIDIASDLHPQEFKRTCRQLGLRTFDTGIDHGTVTVLIEGQSYEHTTFRSDVSCDGRNATISFSDTIEEDLSRRDFTINAMAKLGESLIDPFNGRHDLLQAKTLRTVGEAQARFGEDLLRIVRAARFAARFHLNCCPQLREAARALAPRIQLHVSVERIADELRKAHHHAAAFQRHARDMGFDHFILPFLADLEGTAYEEWLTRLHRSQALPQELYFATLFSPLAPDLASVQDACRHLRLSNELRKTVCAILEGAPHLSSSQRLDTASHLQLMRRLGDAYQHARDYTAYVLHPEPRPGALADAPERLQALRQALCSPLINGADLATRGHKPSPLFKEILEKAAILQAEGAGREQLLASIPSPP